MSFATLEAKANASVFKHLANCLVLIGGETVPGIFKSPSQIVELGVGASDTRPTVTVQSAAVPDSPVDSEIEIDGTPYVIGAHLPDGVGISVLVVERTE